LREWPVPKAEAINVGLLKIQHHIQKKEGSLELHLPDQQIAVEERTASHAETYEPYHGSWHLSDPREKKMNRQKKYTQ
jgi:hypothetical protein